MNQPNPPGPPGQPGQPPQRPTGRPAPRPGSRPTGRRAPPRPRVVLEVLDPDDILIININGRWYRSFTSNSDRYPVRIDIPGEFINENWNLIGGDYTNVALTGSKNDATVEYKVLLNDKTVVHVNYQTEVMPQTFNISFKDTFALRAPNIERQDHSDELVRSDPPSNRGGPSTNRFGQLMEWTEDQDQGRPGGPRRGGYHG